MVSRIEASFFGWSWRTHRTNAGLVRFISIRARDLSSLFSRTSGFFAAI
jgi:hypothetical protein